MSLMYAALSEHATNIKRVDLVKAAPTKFLSEGDCEDVYIVKITFKGFFRQYEIFEFDNLKYAEEFYYSVFSNMLRTSSDEVSGNFPDNKSNSKQPIPRKPKDML